MHVASLQRNALLNGIAGLPAPAFFLGFPPDGGIHDLRFKGFDDKDRRLFLADEHAPDLKRVKRNIDQDEFALGRGSVPCLFAAAKNYQQVMAMLGIDAKRGRKLGVAEAEIGVVRIGNFILECVRVGQRIFAVGNNRHVFHAVSIKVSGDHGSGKFCRDGKGIAELLFYECGELRDIYAGRRCSSRRLACLWRLRGRNACGQQQKVAQKLHEQSLSLFRSTAAGITCLNPARQQTPTVVCGPSMPARWSWWFRWRARRKEALPRAAEGKSTC